MECEVAGCEDEATFELDVPWDDNEFVCAGHARVRSRPDGVVADPLESADEEMPDGASNRGAER
jgi:hypothetical protein